MKYSRHIKTIAAAISRADFVMSSVYTNPVDRDRHQSDAFYQNLGKLAELLGVPDSNDFTGWVREMVARADEISKVSKSK